MPTPNTADAMKRYKAGKAGFTDKAHLKAKGLIPRADGTKRKSPKYEDLDKGDTAQIKTVIKGLKKASGLHAKQAKSLQTQIDDDMDRQPQDKDVKKVKGTQPKKYYKTLDKGMKKKRAAFFRKQKYRKSDDDDDYKPAPGDKGAKTKPSIHTKKFKKMYGEDAPANATGVAVAGTGDDSSTVIVRKRKEMRDRLLKRFKIKESIDRAIPDIVEEPDEIRTRTNQLKELAKGKQEIEEKIKGLENKAKKTGMPYGILKKVYDRGMAAWKGGHRPGTTQQQWAFARVNSFVTKSSGTWGGADKDLAKQVRARG
tara:strand:- start:1468 stop:2403 length:936 start_codon:yes stop_codon:yes gene_type:complete